jgi:hypothetical protein
MVEMKISLLLKIYLLGALVVASITPAVSPLIPVTGAAPFAAEPAPALAAPYSRVASIGDPGVFSYQVVQQPADNPGYVSTEPDKVTEFGFAAEYGSQGFLAHNNLAGAAFSDVRVGDPIVLTYTDGSSARFQVTQVRHLQALRPNSPNSTFVDLENRNYMISAVDLFYQTYGVEDTLILQTCIAKGSELSWGRLFIIASPVASVMSAQ